MTNNTHFNHSALADVKPDIDATLTGIAAQLESYFKAPASNASALQVAQNESIRLSGMLKRAGLDGVVVFCNEIECGLGDLAATPGKVSELHPEVIQRALSAVRDYLVALTGGARNSALRLFPQYQELKKLRGVEKASEMDLFCPDLAVRLPEHLMDTVPGDNAPASLKALRSKYQQALLQWLRQVDVSNSSRQMLHALEGVMRCVPQDVGRAFWWVGCGLLDCVRLDGLPPEFNVRKLLSRIDQQIRAVVEGHIVDVRPVLNEMLYLIARSHAVSPLVEEVKQVYALDDYLPELPTLSSDVQESLLSEICDQLHEAKKCWERAAHGDISACAQFTRHAEQLVLRSEKLERKSLHKTAMLVLKLSEYADTAEHARLLSIDMAMALLLLEDGTKIPNRLDGGFKEQGHLLSERMKAAIRQQPEDIQQLSKLIGLHFQMEQGGVMNTLFNEMLANLQHVEQGLNAYFSSAIQRVELIELLRLLSQIRGGVSILSLNDAKRLLLSMEGSMRHFAQIQGMPKAAEKDSMIHAISVLENYLQHLARGKACDVSPLQKLSVELIMLQRTPETAEKPPAQKINEQPATGTSTQPQVPATVRHVSDEDQNLIDIFLEEAQEVLSIMRDNIKVCQLHPDSIDPLVTIRRGFHTLKGSGRMVGLTELGGVAWCIERAMNNWLQTKKPATTGLLQFINSAEQAFSGWVDVLNKKGEIQVDAEALKAVALQIENGQGNEVVSNQISPEFESLTQPALELELNETLTPEPTALSQESATELKEQTKSRTETDTAPQLTDLEFTSETQAKSELLPLVSSSSEPEAEISSPIESAQEVVMVGEIALTRPLFDIASAEAVQNVAVLQAQFDGLAITEQPVVQKDFVRAAHTLVGLNQTMGFGVVADLANALECWLQAREGKTFTFGSEQRQQLESAIVALGEMVSSICNLHMPHGRNDLVSQLQADTDNLKVDQSLVNKIASNISREAEGLETISVPDFRLDSSAEKVVEIEEQQVQDDIDEQLLPVFLEEAEDLCPKISEGLRAWRQHPKDGKQEQSLKRLLHTLKGSSRMVGAMRIGDIAHAMEDQLSAVANASEEAGCRDALDGNYDRVNALFEELRGGRVSLPGKTEEYAPSEIRSLERGRRATDKSGEGNDDRRATDLSSVVVSGSVLRVRSEMLDKLVSDAGEISVARSRMETELHSFKNGLLELTSSVKRLRQQLRELEIQAETRMQAHATVTKNNDDGFDPLELDRFTRLQELTRFMNESVHDVQTVKHTLLKNLDETASVLQIQGRIVRELHQNLMSVRMVSFNSIADRLYRIVRQTGKELGRRANLELKGMAVELDRSMLEKMIAPFEHLLRNAIVHGLEDDQSRVQAGKLPIGEIRLSVRQEVNEVVFDFSDDGAGLNYAKLREKAIADGLLPTENDVSEEQLAQLIFVPGLTTASEVTESAGRGIGMDVVRSEINALGGTIDVRSKRGLGTQFIVRMPLTLAVTQIVLVRSGETTYAIPSSMVEQVRQLKSADMMNLNKERKIDWHDKTYPLHYLSQLLSDAKVIQENHLRNPVLLLRSGEHRIALHVDELLGNQEAVVKNIGSQLSRLSYIAGATVLGTGVVVLILNPLQLTQRASFGMTRQDDITEPSVNDGVLTNLPLIMVVDDSLTVRKITTRMLRRAGYQVVTATDGVDALEQLENFTPDVMLLDIEMPRMDGFELARALRSDPKTQSLPIIMITSRTADKHREYALQLGVNTYLGKPYQEDELLQKIADYASEHKRE